MPAVSDLSTRCARLSCVVIAMVCPTVPGAWATADEPTPSPTRGQILQQSTELVDRFGQSGLTADVLSRQQNLLQQLQAWVESSEANGRSDSETGISAPQSTAAQRDAGSPSETNPLGQNPSPNRGAATQSSTSPGIAPEVDAQQQRESADADAALPLRQDLADSVWGHLPPEDRDELVRSFHERVLPEYDQWVRYYYEALARKTAEADRRSR